MPLSGEGMLGENGGGGQLGWPGSCSLGLPGDTQPHLAFFVGDADSNSGSQASRSSRLST